MRLHKNHDSYADGEVNAGVQHVVEERFEMRVVASLRGVEIHHRVLAEVQRQHGPDLVDLVWTDFSVITSRMPWARDAPRSARPA